MHVDEAVQGRGQKHVQVLVVLDLCDPAPVRVDFNASKVLLSALVLCRALVLESYLLFLGRSELSGFILLLREGFGAIVAVVISRPTFALFFFSVFLLLLGGFLS